MSYRANILRVTELDAGLRDNLARLYLNYYDGSSKRQFFEDLIEKDEVILVWHKEKLVGFSTFLQYRRHWANREVRIIFSGDTIVDAAHWGQQVLAFAWIARMGDIWREEPNIPMYWFLIVKGHRTYRYLPTFGKSFHPHWSAPRQDLASLADALAQERFADEYNPVTGTVEFVNSHGHLKPDYAEATPEELSKEAVRFFLTRNPGYRRGHELVCLCEISPENMKPLTRRIFEKGAA